MKKYGVQPQTAQSWRWEGQKWGKSLKSLCELYGNTCLQPHLELIQENGEFKDSLSYGYTVKPGQGVKGGVRKWG